jgi:hypothetical protein
VSLLQTATRMTELMHGGKREKIAVADVIESEAAGGNRGGNNGDGGGGGEGDRSSIH